MKRIILSSFMISMTVGAAAIAQSQGQYQEQGQYQQQGHYQGPERQYGEPLPAVDDTTRCGDDGYLHVTTQQERLGLDNYRYFYGPCYQPKYINDFSTYPNEYGGMERN